MPKNLSEEYFRLRLQRISEALRQFRLVDTFNLDDLFRRGKLPSVSSVTKRLSANKDILPPSITPKFLAEAIISKLSQLDPDTKAWNQQYKDLHYELNNIKTGKINASKYHRHIFELLKAIFEDILVNPRIENVINAGLGRIDILFDNPATVGFFAHLKQENIPCKYITFECKNYKEDLNNPEYDQLSGRLNNKRGMVGFLVCRSISNRERAKQHCNEKFNNKNEYIIILEDKDIKAMLNCRRKGNLKGLFEILNDKFSNFFL